MAILIGLGAAALLTFLGGFVTMLTTAFIAEHLGVLAGLGYWDAVIFYGLLTIFLAMTFPTRTVGMQS